MFDFDASLYGGIALFVMVGSGAGAVLVLVEREATLMLKVGAAALALGTTIVLFALSVTSAQGFFLGTALAGAGFGAGFQGSIRSVVPLAAPHQRAGVLSVIFVVSYLGLALPTVVAGVAIAQGTAILQAAEGFGIFIVLLSGLALAGALLPARKQAKLPPRSLPVVRRKETPSFS